jgi:hypothetical protein
MGLAPINAYLRYLCGPAVWGLSFVGESGEGAAFGAGDRVWEELIEAALRVGEHASSSVVCRPVARNTP